MEEKVTSLGCFLRRVQECRSHWRIREHKEIWFRGVGKKHDATLLRPELYRPRANKSLRQISDLLDIENELYEEFQRCVDQFRNEALDREYWDWDSYFLLQHHGGATRLLDWSDGALMAVHFAIRDPSGNDDEDAYIYVLDPDGLNERLKAMHGESGLEARWCAYVKDSQSKGTTDIKEDEWEDAFLPSDKEDRAKFEIPMAPLVLNFPHITRRVAAQRSRFIVLGTDYEFLANEFRREDSAMKQIVIDGAFRRQLRRELRDSGITESVIYPDLDGVGREMKQLWQARK